ncbi:MAG: acyl-CoA/acyl-ACP dehydrogenase [Chloroflexi bacterium]|nr:acyl-CoA/acyl-ACP dehydrogenase [Chloroflexota bacterium]MCL5273931.1 acyl-CoA/acyl-ACP dehydrogenase [Chloroflexota bacterium]
MTEFERILSACDELARRFSERADQHDRAGSFPFENAADLRAAGLPRLTIPRVYGGDGATLKQMALVLQRLAHGDASTALGLAMHVHILGQLTDSRAWPSEKVEEFCREVVSRGLLVNSAASEPDMGSPSRGGNPSTTATPVDGGFRINGRKSWVTFAPALDYVLTSATIQSDAEFPDVGVFAVDSRTPGVRVLNNWSDALSLRASGSSEVVFSDVFVPARWHVETRRRNEQPRGPMLPPAWSACAFAAVYLGIGEAALEQFVAYAKQRVPTALGKPITELPQTRRAIGQMDLTLRAARTVLYSTAEQWHERPEQRHRMTAEFAAAKFLCTNAAVTVTELALRSAGANGLDRKLPLERFFRDARAGLLHPPQDDLALEIMGRQVIDAG